MKTPSLTSSNQVGVIRITGRGSVVAATVMARLPSAVSGPGGMPGDCSKAVGRCQRVSLSPSEARRAEHPRSAQNDVAQRCRLRDAIHALTVEPLLVLVFQGEISAIAAGIQLLGHPLEVDGALL